MRFVSYQRCYHNAQPSLLCELVPLLCCWFVVCLTYSAKRSSSRLVTDLAHLGESFLFLVRLFFCSGRHRANHPRKENNTNRTQHFGIFVLASGLELWNILGQTL